VFFLAAIFLNFVLRPHKSTVSISSERCRVIFGCCGYCEEEGMGGPIKKTRIEEGEIIECIECIECDRRVKPRLMMLYGD